jgi:hypothetical protein
VPERRASRFAAEVLFLVALAVGLTLANVKPLWIAGVMLLGWLIVALIEWAAWRDEPHYGSGLPPRYYVPQVSLPPPRPLEQVGSGYPAAEQRDEAPTWIASPALRAEVLGGEWPVAPRQPDEDTQPHESIDDEEPEPEPELVPPAAEEAPEPEPELELEPAAVAVDEPDEATEEPSFEAAAQPRRRRLWGRRAGDDAVEEADPWLVAELPVAPDEAPEAEPVADAVEETAAPVEPHQGSVRVARHRLDPLADNGAKRRRWRRAAGDDEGTIEVPARPAGVRALPRRSTRED